jgi:hypothetical protein
MSVNITGVYIQGNQLHPLDPGIYTIVLGNEESVEDMEYSGKNTFACGRFV